MKGDCSYLTQFTTVILGTALNLDSVSNNSSSSIHQRLENVLDFPAHSFSIFEIAIIILMILL